VINKKIRFGKVQSESKFEDANLGVVIIRSK